MSGEGELTDLDGYRIRSEADLERWARTSVARVEEAMRRVRTIRAALKKNRDAFTPVQERLAFMALERAAANHHRMTIADLRYHRALAALREPGDAEWTDIVERYLPRMQRAIALALFSSDEELLAVADWEQ
jgi:hypothetical protein